MTTEARIAMLEALLARVQSRVRSAPLTNGATPHAEDGLLASVPSNPLEVPTPMAAFRPSPPPPSASLPWTGAPRLGQRPEAPPLSFLTRGAVPEEDASDDGSIDQTLTETTLPPRLPFARADSSRGRTLEPPPMEVVELDVDPDPSIAPPPAVSYSGDRFASRSRLVSAPPVVLDGTELDGLEDLQDDEEDEEPFALSVPAHPASDPTIEAAPAEVLQADLDRHEETEGAPSSSRRPISIEAKMNELEEDPVPLHPPPPESGKLRAASPAIDLEPPPAPLAPAAPSPPVALSLLTREVLRAEALAQAEVALFVGRARGDATAKTFGDLLEDTLSL